MNEAYFFLKLKREIKRKTIKIYHCYCLHHTLPYNYKQKNEKEEVRNKVKQEGKYKEERKQLSKAAKEIERIKE